MKQCLFNLVIGLFYGTILILIMLGIDYLIKA